MTRWDRFCRDLCNQTGCMISFAIAYWILGHTGLSDHWALGLALSGAVGAWCGQPWRKVTERHDGKDDGDGHG